MRARAVVAAVADGRPAVVPASFTWAVHEGMRGASWLVLKTDGTLLERRFRADQPLGQPLPETKLGSASPAVVRELAALLIAQQFERIQPPSDPVPPTAAQVEPIVEAGREQVSVRIPSHKLDQVPALKAIRDS
jgi:hypothetical protein